MPRTRVSECELDVMAALSRLETGTVAEVRESLDDEVGYTGVLEVLQILEETGAVLNETEGHAYRCFPVVTPAEAGGPALQRLLDAVFHGSAEMLLARLVHTTEPTRAEVRRMGALLGDTEEGA